MELLVSIRHTAAISSPSRMMVPPPAIKLSITANNCSNSKHEVNAPPASHQRRVLGPLTCSGSTLLYLICPSLRGPSKSLLPLGL